MEYHSYLGIFPLWSWWSNLSICKQLSAARYGGLIFNARREWWAELEMLNPDLEILFDVVLGNKTGCSLVRLCFR
jgi:hypothetical protein